MSNPESFIDEVTEEVRRDRLFSLMRRYGWIAVLLVVVVVGGAAFNEWKKATARADAEKLGDAILSAINTEDPATRAAALNAIETSGDGAALVGLILAASQAEEGTTEGIAQLQAISDDAALAPLYRDLAALKLATAPGNDAAPSARIAALEELTTPGAPFRVLAQEQIALAEVEMGSIDAAISHLQELLTDDEASQALRRRASQLIVALGGTPEAS